MFPLTRHQGKSYTLWQRTVVGKVNSVVVVAVVVAKIDESVVVEAEAVEVVVGQ